TGEPGSGPPVAVTPKVASAAATAAASASNAIAVEVSVPSVIWNVPAVGTPPVIATSNTVATAGTFGSQSGSPMPPAGSHDSDSKMTPFSQRSSPPRNPRTLNRP